MRQLQLGEKVELTDGDYVVAELSRRSVKFRNVLSSEYVIIAASELPLRLKPLGEMGGSRGNRELPQPRDIDTVDGEDDKDFRFWLAHIEEVVSGNPVAPNTVMRDQFDPEKTTRSSRAEAKARELTAVGIEVSAVTIRRKAKQFEIGGPAGLVDKRGTRKSSPLGQADPRLVETLIALMAEERDASSGSKGRLIRRIPLELERRFPGEMVPVPSASTLSEYLRRLDNGKYTFGSSPNRRSAANGPKHMYSSRTAAFPGAEVQIDSSPFDVIVLDHYGKPRKAHLTIMLDKATHSILATSVNLVSANGFDHAVLLARCLTPRRSRPQRLSFLDGNLPDLPDLPWAAMLEAGEASDFQTNRPFIKPERIMTDNGADFLSMVYRSACEQHGISITQSSIRTPTDKGAVERAFDSIKTMFLENLPGYTGGSLNRRGRNPSGDQGLWDIATLGEVFDLWVDVVWQNLPTDALRDPFAPGVQHSPNSMYAALFPMTGFVPVALSPDEYISLMPIEFRTIQRDGIELNSRRYDSPLLWPYRMASSGDRKHRGLWPIRWDPYDPTAVWLQDPEDGAWITCDWINDSAFEKPFARTVYTDARRIGAEMGTLDNQKLSTTLLDILDRTAAAQAQRQLVEARNHLALVRPEREALQSAKHLAKPEIEQSVTREVESSAAGSENVGIFDPDEKAI